MNPINNINRAQRFLEDVKLINFKNMKYETMREHPGWLMKEATSIFIG